jgi:hypothetical protein
LKIDESKINRINQPQTLEFFIIFLASQQVLSQHQQKPQLITTDLLYYSRCKKDSPAWPLGRRTRKETTKLKKGISEVSSLADPSAGRSIIDENG